MGEAQPEAGYRVFYRAVKTTPATEDDFRSNKAKGWPARGAEVSNPSLWDGISVLDTLERMRKRARKVPQLGAFIAVLHIPPDAPIPVADTLGPGHYTLHGAPADLLACVAEVVAA